MVRIKAPCYGCKARTTMCHNDCERYLAYKAECDKIRAERMKRYDFTDYICHKVDLNTRKLNR